MDAGSRSILRMRAQPVEEAVVVAADMEEAEAGTEAEEAGMKEDKVDMVAEDRVATVVRTIHFFYCFPQHVLIFRLGYQGGGGG